MNILEKERVLELFANSVKANLQLYNAGCMEGFELTMQDVVDYICFSNKLKNAKLVKL